MKMSFLVMSVKKKKTKIVAFQIDKNSNIIIDEVRIINSFISKMKVLKRIKKILKSFDIFQTTISIQYDYQKEVEKVFSFLNCEYELLSELFIINEAIKVIEPIELKTINTRLKYIKNGWLDFSQIQHIDLNGLIQYTLNHDKRKFLVL